MLVDDLLYPPAGHHSYASHFQLIMIWSFSITIHIPSASAGDQVIRLGVTRVNDIKMKSERFDLVWGRDASDSIPAIMMHYHFS